MNWKTWLLDLLYPPKCPFCGKLLSKEDGLICTYCQSNLPYTKEGKGKKPDFMTKAVSPLYYEKQVRESFLRYKFHGMTAYSAAYASLMADSVTRELKDSFDCICWVPLSQKRLRKRGYDQARLLAEKIAAILNVPIIPALKKIRDSKVQSTLTTAQERRANISGCYAVRSGQDIQGKHILLVDDIFTTGATLSECSRILMMYGAESVCGVTLARKREE